MKKIKMFLVILAMSTVSYGVIDWTYVTIAAAGSTNLVLPANGNKAVVRSLILSTTNANHIYLFEGTAGNITKISPDLYFSANSGYLFGEDEDLNWEGTADTQMKIWFENAPGGTDHKIGYKYDIVKD